MDIALFLVALAAGVLVITSVSERFDIPPPLSLIAVGVAASYVPGVPDAHLEPEIVLLGLLPPLLYSTAIQSSLVDFRRNKKPILLLSVGLVAFTTLGVGVLVHALIPDIEWWAAFAIGAVVAPPDAVAASAVGRRLGLPRQVVTILEGESLLNDATALVSLRTALAAGLAGVHVMDVGWDFIRAAGGGFAVGFVVFVLVAWVRGYSPMHMQQKMRANRRARGRRESGDPITSLLPGGDDGTPSPRNRDLDPVLDTAISLVVPFAAYIAAEEVEASGVIAVVVAGLLLGHKAPILMSAQSRIAERMNYRTISYVLENAVFLLIGLQAAALLSDVGESELSVARIVAVCALTLVAVIVLRLVWVFPARFLLIRPGPDATTGKVPPWSNTFILGWAGMRGVVTLAAAFIIPDDAPHYEVLVLIAFTVVAGTLFIQGLSLPWLARRLHVESPDPMDDALARATVLQQASKEGFKELKKQEYDDAHGVIDLIQQRIDQRNFAAWERLGTTAGQESPSDLYSRVRLP